MLRLSYVQQPFACYLLEPPIAEEMEMCGRYRIPPISGSLYAKCRCPQDGDKVVSAMLGDVSVNSEVAENGK